MTTARSALGAATVLSGVLAAGCMGPGGSTVVERRAHAIAMRDEALATLCAAEPELRARLDAAAGHAVFSSFSIHPGLFAFASGYGVLTDNHDRRVAHQSWHRLTVGPGIALKGLYALAIIDDRERLEHFRDGPWTLIGQLEASLVFGDFGGGFQHGWIYSSGVEVRYVTHTGIALEIELIGIGKVSNVAALNEPGADVSVPPTLRGP
jgi:hypothetical protein